MALKGTEKDKLAELLNQDRTTRRFDNWLWLVISSNNRWMEVNQHGPGNRNWIAKILAEDLKLKEDVLFLKEKAFLDEKYLKWIGDDSRQNNWLATSLYNLMLPQRPISPSFLIGRDLTIALIDFWWLDFQQKIRNVENLKAGWNVYLERDRVFDWFKKEEEVARCNLAWEWLVHKCQDITAGYSEINSYSELVSFFDRPFISDEKRELIVEKIKKNWTQRKYRENLKDKRQCNLVLSNESIKLLDQLGKKYDLTRTELVEVLVKMESKNETYLTEKLRRREALLS